MAAALWWPLAAWLSPAAAWFVFFNAVVGAIAVMSSCNEHQKPSAARRRLCRSGSSVILDRLRSFSIFAVHPVAGGVATGAPIDGDVATVSASDAQFYCYGTREAEAAAATARVIAPEQPERVPQAVDAPARATETSSAAPPAPAEEKNHAAPVAPALENEEDDKAEAEAAEEEAEQEESISLDEAYALAQRRRAQDQASPPPPPSPPALPPQPASAATARTKKAAAEGVSRRRRNKAEADALDGKAELNARAELFIRQFREDLKLQRLNSILSHAHALRSPTAAAR